MSKLLPSTGFRRTKWNLSNKEIISEILDQELAPHHKEIIDRSPLLKEHFDGIYELFPTHKPLFDAEPQNY